MTKDERLSAVNQSITSKRVKSALSVVLDQIGPDVDRLNEILISLNLIEFWDPMRQKAMEDLGKKRLFGLTSGIPLNPPYAILLCWSDLKVHSDSFIRGIIAHEFGHAVNLANGDPGAQACASADIEALAWGFSDEIEEQKCCRIECRH